MDQAVASMVNGAQLRLKAGWNTLLLEVLNGAEDWGFFARLVAADAGRLPLLMNEDGQVAVALVN